MGGPEDFNPYQKITNPIDQFNKLSLEDQEEIVKQLFTSDELKNFGYWEAQQNPHGSYEDATSKVLSNPGISGEAMLYIRRNDLLKDKEDELKSLLENK